MSDTPITDAEAAKHPSWPATACEFARGLEWQRAKIEAEYQKQVSVTIAQQNQIGQLRNEIARLNGQTNFYCECGGVNPLAVEVEKLRKRIELWEKNETNT